MVRGRCDRECRLLFLIILLLQFCFEMTLTRRVDCTKYVFAPVCRGISAKRSRISSAATFREEIVFPELSKPSGASLILSDPVASVMHSGKTQSLKELPHNDRSFEGPSATLDSIPYSLKTEDQNTGGLPSTRRKKPTLQNSGVQKSPDATLEDFRLEGSSRLVAPPLSMSYLSRIAQRNNNNNLHRSRAYLNNVNDQYKRQVSVKSSLEDILRKLIAS